MVDIDIHPQTSTQSQICSVYADVERDNQKLDMLNAYIKTSSYLFIDLGEVMSYNSLSLEKTDEQSMFPYM